MLQQAVRSLAIERETAGAERQARLDAITTGHTYKETPIWRQARLDAMTTFRDYIGRDYTAAGAAGRHNYTP